MAYQTVHLLPPSVTPCTWLERREEWKKSAPAATLARMPSELCSGGSDKNEHFQAYFRPESYLSSSEPPQNFNNKKIIVALQEWRLRHGRVEQLAPGHMAQESPPVASHQHTPVRREVSDLGPGYHMKAGCHPRLASLA